MSIAEEQELVHYIDRIIAKTQTGSMSWIRSNPTTYTWTKKLSSDREARLTIQKVMKRRGQAGNKKYGIRPSDYYIFLATDIEASAQVLTINTEDLPDLRETLRNLYNTISLNITRKGLDFLRDIVED